MIYLRSPNVKQTTNQRYRGDSSARCCQLKLACPPSLLVIPRIRQGLKPLSHSQSQFKLTEDLPKTNTYQLILQSSLRGLAL